MAYDDWRFMSNRPEILLPLFQKLTNLDGIGSKIAMYMRKMHIERPRDLLFTLPYSGVERHQVSSVNDAVLPTTLTLEVQVLEHIPSRVKSLPYKVTVQDQKKIFGLVFFHAQTKYLRKMLPVGARRLISGKVELFDGVAQMVHPDYILCPGEGARIDEFEAVYPLAAGITQKIMAKATRSAVRLTPILPEWIDPAEKIRSGWPDWKTAVERAHDPKSLNDTQQSSKERNRLAYDELLAHQLTLAIARQKLRLVKGLSTWGDGKLRAKIITALPYKLTKAQIRVVAEIGDDMAEEQRMNRLLQGDVGSGKTLVAFLTLLIVVEAGCQGVLMAPTEILALQHFDNFRHLAKEVGIEIEVLTGRDKGAKRAQKLARLESGELKILIGTHAVFQKDVVFADLRLAIIDEQHRFGVRQRLELGRKGRAVDVLVMTATPIPRSLALAQYGDMDVSVLDEKPAGRRPIKTAMVSTDRLQEVVEQLRQALGDGRQAYWVCPLVEESELLDYTSVENRVKTLRAALGEGVVGLVHGQLAVADKDAAMARFESGETKVLVATTVIEVGVDVPNASIMVIERAESFGLSQLHQLRGRVGRGVAESTCLLMYKAPVSEIGRRRLSVLRDTEDGFAISQTDLEIRGAGDLIGTVQSGLPRFRVADLESMADLMAKAQSDARSLLVKDPDLNSERGRAARVLLWLMEKNKAIRLISVG